MLLKDEGSKLGKLQVKIFEIMNTTASNQDLQRNSLERNDLIE